MRRRVILGGGLLSCALGLVGYGVNPLAAVGLTSPGDDEALTSPMARPIGAVSPRPANPDKRASGFTKGNPGFTKGNPLWAIPLSSLSATRERPLFSPSRRPPRVMAAAPPPQAPPPQPAAPAQPPLTLVGTAIGGGQSIGIFLDQSTNAVVRLRMGEGVTGWTVHSIGGRDVVLEQDHRDVTLSLPTNDGAKNMTASVAPPAASVPTAAPAPARTAPMPVAAARPPTPALSPAAMHSPASSTQTAEQKPAVTSPGMWLDGDGQIIKAPARATYADGKMPTATWVDGDGRSIAPPPPTLVGQH